MAYGFYYCSKEEECGWKGKEPVVENSRLGEAIFVCPECKEPVYRLRQGAKKAKISEVQKGILSRLRSGERLEYHEGIGAVWLPGKEKQAIIPVKRLEKMGIIQCEQEGPFHGIYYLKGETQKNAEAS